MKRTTTKTAAANVTRVVCYVRVSLDKMAEHGWSLDAQKAKLEAYAALYDLAIVETIVDAQTAKNLDRPGLQRALDMLRTGKADALLVVKLDRLTRSVRDLGELIETHFASGKAALLSVSENIDTRSAGGRLVLNVLASVSQWEREAIGERTSAAMQHMRAEGQYTGGAAPYGYALGEDGTLQPVEAEQEVIAVARELRAAGLSLRAVAEELATRGHVSRTGKAFQPHAVDAMVAA
jgi:site-specific DNA recombinase